MNKRIVIAVLLLMVVAANAFAATTVRGKVVTADGATPYPEVEVVVDSINKTVYTDRDGEFYLPNLAPGTYSIRVKTTRSVTTHNITALAQPVTDVRIAVK